MLLPCIPRRLLFRTLNQDLGLPNHNNDYLAVKMRDELMPIRSVTVCVFHMPIRWVGRCVAPMSAAKAGKYCLARSVT